MRFSRTLAAFATVLVAAVLASAGSGCKKNKQSEEFGPGAKWLDDMRSRIEEKITDVSTATALLAEVDNIEAEVNAFDAETQEYYARLGELDRDYHSRRADFEAAIREFNTARLRYRDRLVDIRFRMHDLTTPEQWKVVADVDESLLAQWQREYEL
jgi:predicted  nucleic acid-binding Zn-ribbon protein